MEDIVKTIVASVLAAVSVFFQGFFGAIMLFVGLAGAIIILLIVLAMLLITLAGAVLVSPFALIYFLTRMWMRRKTLNGAYIVADI